MFGGYFPFNFVENSRIHGIIYGREKSMQLYETIEYPQPSNTVICRGKHPSASLKLVFSPKIRTFSVEHIWHEGLIVVQNEDEILDVSFGTTQSPNVKTLALG